MFGEGIARFVRDTAAAEAAARGKGGLIGKASGGVSAVTGGISTVTGGITGGISSGLTTAGG